VRTSDEGIPEHGDEEDVWAPESRNNRRIRKNCIMRRFVIFIPRQTFY
jgi:hypothetical protein